jgi:hypothetical protein
MRHVGIGTVGAARQMIADRRRSASASCGSAPVDVCVRSNFFAGFAFVPDRRADRTYPCICRAGWLGRDVERREIVEVVLDIRAFGDLESHLAENGEFELVHGLADRVDMRPVRIRARTGKRDVEGFMRARRVIQRLHLQGEIGPACIDQRLRSRPSARSGRRLRPCATSGSMRAQRFHQVGRSRPFLPSAVTRACSSAGRSFAASTIWTSSVFKVAIFWFMSVTLKSLIILRFLAFLTCNFKCQTGSRKAPSDGVSADCPARKNRAAALPA